MIDEFFRTFYHLSDAFWHAVLRSNGERGFVIGIENHTDYCLMEDQTTKFFLDFSEDHPCSGFDWFGACKTCAPQAKLAQMNVIQSALIFLSNFSLVRSTVLGVLCIAVHLLSWLPRWLIYEPLFLMLRPSQSKLTDQSSRTIQRFSQVLTAASFHILMAFFAWRVLSHKGWLWHVKSWSEGFFEEGGATVLRIEPDFKFYYLLYAARYISDLISLFFEPSKSVRQ
jgi:hypothetical protein